MQYLDLTLPTAEENLALDEALLEEAEAAGQPTEALRLWESSRRVVVVGRSSRIADEVHLDTCRARGIPVLRRTSGGAAVLIGPGCLMYALVLSYQLRPALRAIDGAHRFVLGTLAGALRGPAPGVRCRGTSDLAVGDRKFSGNSMRCKRDHFLYHGSLLYDFPLERIGECLKMPPRQPEYRRGRAHAAFLVNLPLGPAILRQTLLATWDAAEARSEWPHEITARLVAQRYSQRDWHERL